MSFRAPRLSPRLLSSLNPSKLRHKKTAHDLGSARSSSSCGGGGDDDQNEEDDDDPDALAVARFLRSTPGLSRAVVGDLLGDAAPRVATAVLGAFARSFDWRGAPFEEALRAFLDAFRLPGEAQKIYRVLDAWSVAYFEANKGAAATMTAPTTATTTAGDGDGSGSQQGKKEAPPPSSSSYLFPFASADAVHVLAFSAIMLNTDAHNSRVRAKMTRAQFVANNRGINAGGDLPEGALGALYDSIVERPIRGPREEEGVEAGSVGGGSCSWDGGDCCNNNSNTNGGSRSGLVLGRGASFGGGGSGGIARVASAGWSGRAGAANNGGSTGGGTAAGRPPSASGDGGASGGGEVRRLLQQQQRTRKGRGLFSCFASGSTKN